MSEKGQITITGELMDGTKIAILLTQFIALAVRLFTIVTCWQWFIVEEFGLRALYWYEALFIQLLLTVLTTFNPFAVNDERSNDVVWASFMATAVGRITGCGFILLLGLIIRGVSV